MEEYFKAIEEEHKFQVDKYFQDEDNLISFHHWIFEELYSPYEIFDFDSILFKDYLEKLKYTSCETIEFGGSWKFVTFYEILKEIYVTKYETDFINWLIENDGIL